jgi:ParB family transcriptional regulator, chromosome partitioning protein
MGKLNRDVFFATSADLPRIVEIDLDNLIPNPDQPRKSFDEEVLRELASSIDKHGLIQPITIKKNPTGDNYILVAGERRYRAHKLLGKTTIPAIVTEGAVDEIALIENLQREDLNPIDTAEALAKMSERYHYTQQELGKVLGKAQTTVSELLKLNDLPLDIKLEYRNSTKIAQTVSRSVLLEITRLKAIEEQLALWEAVKNSGITVKATRAKKKDSNHKVEKPPALQTLYAGRKFVRILKDLRASDFTQDKESYTELLEIRKQVNDLVDRLTSTQEGAVKIITT